MSEAGVHAVRRVAVFGLALSCILLSGCRLKSDAQLTEVFDHNAKDFDQLAQLRAETDGHPKEYAATFRRLGIRNGTGKRQAFPGAPFLYEECSGNVLSHICKGYAHSEEPLTPLKLDLDESFSGIGFKPLARGWYLFVDYD